MYRGLGVPLRLGGERKVYNNQSIPTAERAKSAKVNAPRTDVSPCLYVSAVKKRFTKTSAF
jgi:hypothetical protein